ncbi:hypothetical protein [Vibrio lentus]|uniref:hypothetical protein n=1 Tax=Vibrio lentus TaxID=136468 RepID=UPI000C831256|nr:hypothetical protein [Vibrio lentus]PMG70652.1 hypothetical protein BCU86_04970 [Vibrio lentus]
MKLSTLALIAFSSISTSAIASSNNVVINDWNGKNHAMTYELGFSWYYQAKIDSSFNGRQSLYLQIEHMSKDSCDRFNYTSYDTPNQYERQIPWKINGQPVKMFEVCTKYGDSDSYYVYAYPVTETGRNFVINAFKNSKRLVKIEGLGHDFNLSAKGFTQAWNNFGGNAI